MKLPKPIPKQVVWGLGLALVIGIGLGMRLQSAGLAGLASSRAERSAIVGLRAVAEIVEGQGIDGEGLQAAVESFVEQDPVLTEVRVVRFQGIRLVASTAPEDTGDSAAPRKMARDEKPLYDLGQELRAAVDANLQEGRAWKEEIEIRRGSSFDGRELPGGLALAVPVAEDGKVVGAVLGEALATAERTPVPKLPALLALLVPVLLLLALRPVLGGKALLTLLLAAVLLCAGLWLHGWRGLAGMAAGREANEAAMVERLEEAKAAVAASSGLTVADPERWDVDRFRQPLGLVSTDGPVASALAERNVEERSSYWKLMVPALLISLLCLGWVALGGATRTGSALVRHRTAYFYVVPALLGMLVLVFFPFSYGILLSFTNQNIYNTDAAISEIWIGLQNYQEILTDFAVFKVTPEGRVFDYQNFYWTLGFTVIWTVSNVAVGVSLGLLLALILNTRGLVLRPAYRVLLILPWAMPNYITALIWRGMFHSQFGVINQVIQMFGGEALSWFDTPFTAFITVLSTNGWLSFPFMMVISLGALQSIPADLYEAARVDGASRWQQFRTITLPSLKPALVPAVILSVIWTFNQFNVIYLVSAGEPGSSTEILITQAYKLAFEQYRYGYAAAYSVVIFLILLVYGVWQNRVTKATEGI